MCRFRDKTKEDHEQNSKFKIDADLKFLEAAWNSSKLFEISCEEQSTDFIQYQKSHNIEVLFGAIPEMYETQHMNNIKRAKESTEFLPKMIDLAAKKLKSNNLIENFEAIRYFKEISVITIDCFQFKQTQHILSVAMFNLVKIRQNLPIEQRSALNELQAAVSHGFASYGVAFVSGSITKKLHGDKYCIPAHPFYIEMTDLIEPGMEVYSSQYPNEYVENLLQMKKILKKALAWNKRSIELGESNQEDLEKYHCCTKMLNNLMVETEAAIKKEKKDY